MKKEEEEEGGFRVTDRRLFRETGERREEQPPEPEVKQAPEPQRAAPQAAGPQPAGPQPTAGEPPPGTAQRIDFPSYLLSYYSQGLMFLGEVPNPMTNVVEQDPEGARHTIDLLEMLQEKTRGNLTPEEAQLLESVLYELRMKFMAKTRRIKF